MCLIVFSNQPKSEYIFTLAANRDEFYNRPAKRAHFWDNIPGLLAGKDLKAGGTWLGITQNGDIAFITNYRDPKYFKESEKSRGDLLTKFLSKPKGLNDFSNFLMEEKDKYNGYNLVFGNVFSGLNYFSNVSGELKKLKQGIFGLSNAYLDTPWPKVSGTKKDFIEHSEPNFEILSKTDLAEDDKLPNTGIPYEMEKKLSARFIQMEGYGTRCSTLISITKNKEVIFKERTYRHSPEDFDEVLFRFRL